MRKAVAQVNHLVLEYLGFRRGEVVSQAELTPIRNRLNALLERLQTAFERERQFSDDLAHEFRTPIAELRSMAELWLKWPEARAPDADQTVLAIALQMESLINRFLAIARSDAKQVKFVSEEFSVQVDAHGLNRSVKGVVRGVGTDQAGLVAAHFQTVHRHGIDEAGPPRPAIG